MSTVFEKMCSPAYLQAFETRLREKLFGMDAAEMEELFSYLNSDAFQRDMECLKAHQWPIRPPRQVFVRKSHSNRRRIVYCFDGHDGMLLKYMTFVLMDLDHLHADSLCSFRKDNRTASFFRKVRKIDPSRQLYIAKADFHEYGASVDQDLLLEILKPFFTDDPDFYAFVSWLMTRNLFYRNGELIHERVSIIPGLPIGNFLNNLYLRDMDLELEKEHILYMRYTDDIACFTETEEQAQKALEKIARYAEKRRLTINREKSGIIRPQEEAELLGIQIFSGGFDIGANAIRKLKDKLLRYSRKKAVRVTYGKITHEQAMRDMVRFYDRTFFGNKSRDHELNWVVHAFPMITRIDGLKEIDACAQEAIRFAGTGKHSNAKYRVRYKQMRRAGYRSLVHAYYHGYQITDWDSGEKENSAWRNHRS